jgi:hypothetical protein
MSYFHSKLGGLQLDSWFKIIPPKPSSQDAKRNAKQDYQRVGSINRCTAARYCSYVATPAATAAATAATFSLRHFRLGKCVVK